MDFGFHLPFFGPDATRETVLGLARDAERLGFDSLWVSDHVVVPCQIRSRYPYSPTGAFPLPPGVDFLEPLTTLALVAGATERVRLGTSVLIVPHRHPVLAAKMLATLDHLAPGRVIAGVGVGWMREEIELLGAAPWHERGAWTDEALRVMRASWREDPVSFEGRFFRFGPVTCLPQPRHRSIPIWVGGHSSRALRRAAELGDGWHGAYPTAGEMRTALDGLRAACQRAGRDFDSLTLSARLGLPARKSAQELVDSLAEFRALGVQHVILEPSMRALADTTALLERFASDVKPKL